MATSSSDVSESSDIVHEFPCKPCSDDGKNIEGVNFCAECQTYFCQACVQFHNKCFKTHTIFNKSGVKSGKLQFEKTQSGLACDKHAGNLIQMYCREHDTVCCAVCIAVDHRLCKSADFIPKLAKEILNGRDKNDVKTSLEGIRKQLNSMKAKKLQQIKDVGEEKDENLKEIVKMKEQIIARVEEMERNSVQQVQKKHDQIVRAIKTDIDSIDVKLNAVQSNIEKVNAFKGDNEAKLFVVLNKAHEVEVSSSSFIDENGKGEYAKIDFVVNQDIASFIGKIDAFGNVRCDGDREIGNTVATYSQIHVPEASIVSQVSVKGSGSCILDNDQIIILVSESIVRLDKTYKLLDEYNLSGALNFCYLSGAINLCQVGPTEIAVLYGNKISFVDAGKSLLISRYLTMHSNRNDTEKLYPVNSPCKLGDVNCFGLSVSNEKLFVCDKVKIEKWIHTEYSNRIIDTWYNFGVSVYDLEGCHIETHSFLSDEKDDLGIDHATFSSYNSCMYISTVKKGLLVFDMINKTLSVVTHKRLLSACYGCEGRNGQYFVCGRGSNNIFLVDRKSNTMEEILGSIDGILYPTSVMYIKQENRLLVTSAIQDVKVYQLK